MHGDGKRANDMYTYEPATIHRLLAALDEAIEEHEATVTVGDLEALREAWRAGLPGAAHSSPKPETTLVRRRRRYGMGLSPSVSLPAGRLVAVAVREAGSEAISLLIGEWVLMSEDDGLLRRAANAVEDLCTCAIGGAGGDRQQACATEWEGGVALIRQLPYPKVELWDIGEGRD